MTHFFIYKQCKYYRYIIYSTVIHSHSIQNLKGHCTALEKKFKLRILIFIILMRK